MANMFPSISFLDILFAIGGLMFAGWPLVLIAPLKYRGNGLGSLLGMWVILAVIRLFLVFDQRKLFDLLIIPEPTRTTAFFITGAVLAALFGIVKLRRFA